MTTRGEHWARLRRSVWQPPRAHGEQPRERVVGPLELFYDLAVVVPVAQAAHHLAGHLTWAGLGEFAAVFTLESRDMRFAVDLLLTQGARKFIQNHAEVIFEGR